MSFHLIAQCTFFKLMSFGIALANIPVRYNTTESILLTIRKGTRREIIISHLSGTSLGSYLYQVQKLSGS